MKSDHVSNQEQKLIPKLPCMLCHKIDHHEFDSSFVTQSGSVLIFFSHFETAWPGSLILIFKKHVTHHYEMFASVQMEAWKLILDLEKILVATTKCSRVNVAKFGNVCTHLHWHLVPRYANELLPHLNPWEILLSDPNYKSDFPVRPALERENLTKQLNLKKQSRESGYFGSIFFIRHKNPALRETYFLLSLEALLKKIRRRSEDFESLLMLQNYGKRIWDTVGGNADKAEFPFQTAKREVLEELGWNISEGLEVTRQWRDGVLKGFMYLAKPKINIGQSNTQFLKDDPWRVPCNEVAHVAFLSISKILNSHSMPAFVKDRHAALVQGLTDFSTD